jgi:hypothetical protein
MRETHYEHQNQHQQFVGGDNYGLVNSIANSQFGWIGFFLAISPTLRGLLLLISNSFGRVVVFLSTGQFSLDDGGMASGTLWVSSTIKGWFYCDTASHGGGAMANAMLDARQEDGVSIRDGMDFVANHVILDIDHNVLLAQINRTALATKA